MGFLTLTINHIVTGSLAHVWLIPFGIILGTLILEDATTIIVGVLAADGLIGIPDAVISLFIGIVLGDFILYWLGYLASGHAWVRWLVEHERSEPIRAWLEDRFEGAVFTSRFIPGTRLPTYTAAGFLKLPFRRFAPPVLLGGIIWTTLFFAFSYEFGNLTESWLGAWRWPIAIGFVVVWLGINQWRIRRGHAKRKDADIQTKEEENIS